MTQTIGGIANAAEFTIAKKAPSKFILKLKNNDIFHLKPRGDVFIYDVFGKKVGEAEIPQKTILPGMTRQFPIEFFLQTPESLKWLPASISDFLVQNFFIGKYQAKLDIRIGDQSDIESFPIALTFFSFPWKFWIVLILIFGMLLFFISKFRKRITLALKTLVKRET